MPRPVSRVLQVLGTARALLVDEGGWTDPNPDQALDVHLEAAPARAGWVSGLGRSDRQSIGIAGPPAAWSRLALHQYLHVLQLATTPDVEPWFYEATAMALEARLLGTRVPAESGRVEAALARPQDGFLGVDMVRSALFIEHLAGDAPVSLLRDTWRRAAARPGSSGVEALRVALRLRDMTFLRDAWRVFAVGLAYPEPGDRPALPGRVPLDVPAARPTRVLTSLPASEVGQNALEVDPFGAAFVQLRDLGDVGAVRVELDADPGQPVVVDVLISWKDAPTGWMLTPVPLSDGHASIGLPFGPETRAALIVRHGGRLGEPPVRVDLTASVEPSFPFELTFLAADAAPGRVDLSWGTDTETEVAGWRIHRATDPQGPFLVVNPMPLPSMGDSDAPLAYHFIDTDVVGGTRYYYRVEGITRHGLARTSSMVAGRAVGLP